ncbi:GntR family transcriptional regulator [Arthrobacter sp. AQ5-05]|uniref:GntR family transcriptional regulator n=1 Tax=Arthrobacter sp. AQ5-05 TaxID=2184581 RepID=UPI000DCC66BA|nr:GntR family transcriptional regulator [Arthrobacter sp. AQ5-05]RAX48284.1 GntR family transcriptional regulator [Arthrobacter sp. AQ5-05]
MINTEELLERARGLEFEPGQPTHQSISNWLGGIIAEGLLSPGTRLPAERVFAQAMDVSRMTLRQGLDTLLHEGRIVRAVGSRGGSFVAETRVPVDISNLMGLSAQLLKSVHSASSKILSARTIPADRAVAEALQLAVGDPVHRIHRVRFAAATPVVLEESYFPAELFPGLPERNLGGSIYAVMGEGYGLAPFSSVEELNPAVAGAENARHLEIGPTTAVLGIKRTGLARDGRPVEYSEDLIRTDRLKIMVSGRSTE